MVPMPYEAPQVLGASVFNPSGSESFSLKISASWQDTYISTAAKACGVPGAGFLIPEGFLHGNGLPWCNGQAA